MTILPGPVSPKRSTLTPQLRQRFNAPAGALEAKAGAATQLSITPSDEWGNLANTSTGDAFAVTAVISGQSATLGSRAFEATNDALAVPVQVRLFPPHAVW